VKQATSRRLTFQNRFLRVDLDAAEVTWSVTEKATGVVWRMAPSAAQDVTVADTAGNRRAHAFASSADRAVQASRNGLPGACIGLRDLGLGIHAFLDGRALVVEIERCAGDGPAKVRDVLFPRHFLLPRKPGVCSTWTLGQGAIVPATMRGRFHHPEGYSEQEMAFHGAAIGDCGMVAIAETPFDLYVAMSHLEGEAPATFFHWLPSLGDLRYTRRVRFTFGRGLDFVQQAKLYRRHVQREGYFVSLADKARGNPNVAKLKGAAWVNSSTGFGLHDQYIDIYADAPSYDPARFMIKENGRPNLLNVWCGGLCAHLCGTESLKFVRRNFVEGVKDQYMYHNSPSIYDLCRPDASYLDCFCRIHECFHPQHPLTRAETAWYQRECLRTVRGHGRKVVQSCEHAKWYAIPDLDFSYGLGHQKADVLVEGGGHETQAIGLPVPLWNLVFHDAVWTPEHSSEYGRAFLYGSSVFFHAQAELPPDDELAWKMKLCRFNEVVGFDEMTDFRMSGDGQELRSEFSSGVGVTYCPAEKTCRLDGPRSVSTRGSVRLP
jgi:hypothetical protein